MVKGRGWGPARDVIEVPHVEVPAELGDLPIYFGRGLPYENGGWAVPLSGVCLL